ncbi:MAG: BolA family protein [Myxococcota bacterium]|nr:BolA family protein [Myxococcota bacterium]
MSRKRRIEELLTEVFSPTELVVEDFSHQHSTAEGSESHIEVYIISEAFNGLSMVQKHRKMYQVLQDEMNSGLHALKLQVMGTAESPQSPTQPPRCKGGE